MAQLSCNIHPKLSEDIISLLNKTKISTVVEFIVENDLKLIRLTRLSYEDVLSIKGAISKMYSGAMKKSSTFLKAEQENVISTGIARLDTLLKGGLYPGQIYELCGISSSGKTQLCLTIAANAVLNPDTVVRYIDGKGDFCARRIQTFIENKNHKQCQDDVMRRLRISYVLNLYHLIKILHCIKDALKTEETDSRTKIIIIDSLPAVVFRTSNDTETIYALNHLSNTCRSIANEFSLAIITVNLTIRWTTADEQSTSGQSQGILMPTLGKYWSQVPNTRLLAERLEKGIRKLSVWKSTQLQEGLSCSVSVTNTGIV